MIPSMDGDADEGDAQQDDDDGAGIVAFVIGQ